MRRTIEVTGRMQKQTNLSFRFHKPRNSIPRPLLPWQGDESRQSTMKGRQMGWGRTGLLRLSAYRLAERQSAEQRKKQSPMVQHWIQLDRKPHPL